MRWTKWLDPTVNVLYALSGVSLVFSPTGVIFAGVGVLLQVGILISIFAWAIVILYIYQAAKDVRASQDTLIDIFERIEFFSRRLEIYTELPLTMEMMDVIVQIMVEVLCILAIATKEIKQGRTKKYLKRIVGRADLEDALKRLDKLIQEVARMASAQILKATHTVEDRVIGVTEMVVGVDDRVAGIEDGVASVNDRVACVNDRVAGVDDGVKGIDARVRAVDDEIVEVINDGKQARALVQHTASDVEQVKRDQSRENIHKWLSPPDPSTNHNIACSTHHKKTATWFFQGSAFNEWISTGSLLWIYGKPGSGKSVLCSTIIQDIEACKAGKASMGYLYFDFRNANKQHLHDLIPSLLTQLSARSNSRCDILSTLYKAHDNGKKQPSDDVLTRCLKKLLTLPDELPVYLVIDALDECHDASGIPSHRERVLRLLNELLDLHLPNLHICVTSRPEVDIRHAIEPLTSLRISLHDQSGQKQDIVDYVRSVVYSDSEPIMRRWRTEVKELVIETLSARADGMFRWVFCQLEMLRHCLPSSVRRTLDELPESLDETYERILKEIKKPNKDHARRLLQCLVVAVRPALHVEELAEVLAVDFEDAEGIPKLNANWRWEDHEQALLSSCSNLIAIVDSEDPRVVQFSHFSVKEFLTSSRLGTPSRDVSDYHIVLEPAHTILAQACLGILLRLEDRVDKDNPLNGSPLAGYAARHWVTHAQFEKVSLRVGKAMEHLFDSDLSHFSVWLRVYDVDHRDPPPSPFFLFSNSRKSEASPLYYAALCGFDDLAKHLIIMHPRLVNARGGCYLSPLVAALARGHLQIVQLLRDNDADPNVRGNYKRTPLHSAVYYGNLKAVEKLIEFGADTNAQDNGGRTPLYNASQGVRFDHADVIPLLLGHGADVNARAEDGSTPLHEAAFLGALEVARLLLEHSANVEAKDEMGRTPSQYASEGNRDEMAKFLLEYGTMSAI